MLAAMATPRLRSGRSTVFSDGNCDGNDDNHQRPGATVNSHVLPAHQSLSWTYATPEKQKVSGHIRP
jgi:hypothetical protein